MIKNKQFFIFLSLFNSFLVGNFQESFWTETYLKALNDHWGKFESLSGPGSSSSQTNVICKTLPRLIKELSVRSILDVPCGDFNWMKTIPLEEYLYIGIDIVKPLIQRNCELFENEKRKFICLDVTKDILPCTDFIICRDLLVHFSVNDIRKTLKNFKQSGAKFLLTTTFINPKRNNQEIETGSWQPLNLQKSPFNFPEPILIINEQCTEQNGVYNDKCLGLWRLSDINV